MKNSDPNMAKKTRVIATDAAVKRGLAKKLTSRMGWSVRRSQSTKAVRRTTAIRNEARIFGWPQPLDGPSMIP